MKTSKTLHASNNQLADTFVQLDILNERDSFPLFENKLKAIGLHPLKSTGIETLQLNLGYMCNQTCKHCHVDAGPDRTEIMTKEIMLQVLGLLEKYRFQSIDLTGGAPEMNPLFRWFVEEIRKRDAYCKIIVRCNLTIMLANKKYHDLPEFFKLMNIEVVSSLPFYNAERTDRQRGEGVFEISIKALQLLNDIGYGKDGSGLILNLVYNPSGAFLPASQSLLEHEFKIELHKHFNIVFNQLFAITNMPISRYLDYLLKSGNYNAYMEKLIASFNPSAATKVMCRNSISVGWDGYLYDCDFNQMLGLKIEARAPRHISEFIKEKLDCRNIVTNQHCFGCTAGAGSSCAGEISN